jgi:hypothetical protein
MKKDPVTEPAGHPADIDDPLTDVLRPGAQRLLVQAIEAEAEAIRQRCRKSRRTRSGQGRSQQWQWGRCRPGLSVVASSIVITVGVSASRASIRSGGEP